MINARNPKIIVVLNDLFFISKIREAAKHLAVDLEFVKSPEALADALKSSENVALVIIDLNIKGDGALPAIRAVKSSDELKSVPIIGYLSHVQTDLHDAALEAGCDVALPKSKFSRDLPAILAQYA